MSSRKLLNFLFLVTMLVSLIAGASGSAFGSVPDSGESGSAFGSVPEAWPAPWEFASQVMPQDELTVAAAPASPTDESQVPHYFGPNPNWALSPLTLPDVTVTIAAPATMSYGNALQDRAYASDFPVAVGELAPVLVVLPTPLPAGTLTSFQTWNQASAGASSFPSAGNVFHAYVLRPTGVIANQYTVAFDSGLLTVPDLAGGPSAVASFPVPGGFPVLANDVLAFYGQGIPVDVGGGSDVLSYLAPAAPPAAPTAFTLGVDAGFPILSQDRTYSFAATFSAGAAGTSATAVASVGANGAVTGITITNPGSGYTSAPAVAITGAGSGATADAVVTLTGIVTGITVDTPGTGYTAPAVTIGSETSGGASVQATATASGGVENNIVITNGGGGYTFPTVEFDMPDDPNGTIASGHAVLDGTGAVTSIVVDNPGSGYYTAPNVKVYNGTLFDPVNCGLAAAQAARAEMIKSQDKGKFAPKTSTAAAAGAITAAPLAAAASAADCGFSGTTTLAIQSVTLDTFGADYTSAPDVIIADLNDPTNTSAAATATVDAGGVTAINVTAGGSGYITSGGIKKFVDPLPELCDPAVAGSCPDWTTAPDAKALPLAVSTEVNYNGITADQYEIALVQFRTSFSSSMPGTLTRGYVQLDPGCTTAGGTGDVPGSQCSPLQNELVNGTLVDTGYFGVTPPQWLGPVIAATKDKPVRIIFRNLLPADPNNADSVSDGDLFLPVDSTLMGSGMADIPDFDYADTNSVMDEARNPDCTQYPKNGMCFKDDRATLHLHGGISPWISDGTPHQWITPAGEDTNWPQGVSVQNVPDMFPAGCDAADDGCMTFYYTNQQSARFMFYHDHAWGITRLNVYAGEAAGYLISDDTEQKLMATGGPLESVGLGIPLVVQDRTFVPQDTQMYNQYDGAGNVASYGQDPTWDQARWGGWGNMWFHHVYMPAQNPGDPSGMSAYGRWMYGPWFWPPATNTKYGPIANPYYNMDPKATPPFSQPLATPCNLDDPATWQYDTDPFCEPALIPGTPLISTGMEQFNDTPTVNGVAYPTITLEPKSYRFRILNAANDRFFNFQWYVGDPTTASTGMNNLPVPEVIGATEVAFKTAELEAAQTDPNIFPTPDTAISLPGPDWIQIGTEGGFLPAPVVVDGQQVTTWIIDPTRFDVGNVDKHSLLIAPAERADVVVDFSQFAGQTLIMYNDAPAAFPARVASYDYYTGAPDLSPNGAPAILPGYGPNTRTIMQVKIAAGTPEPFNLAKLENSFSHKADGSGVFESGQHPIIVGQAAYNSAYGTGFAGSSNCNTPPNSPTTGVSSCDGLVRVNDTSIFGFNTLMAPTTRMAMPLQPKAIHDEMNATSFDEYGRMQATLGMEAQPPAPGAQNVTLAPYVNPPTELINATNLPKNDVVYDADTGLPTSDLDITPIASADDGTQIWRITHNGVDTHPVHFHLYDVQTLNRVTWDNIIIPPDATELGWKDTLRVSPLEDTIVALRPIIPELPWELPNAVRNLSPMMATGSTQYFNNVDPQGNPTAPIVNQLINFGWEYVYHCHILTHEEMDMMHPVAVAMPPVKPDGLAWSVTGNGGNTRLTLTWNDNSIADTAYVVQKMNGTGVWTDVVTIQVPLDPNPTTPAVEPNTTGPMSFTDTTFRWNASLYSYRVVAQNTVGYRDDALNPPPGGWPEMTASSMSDPVVVIAAPTNLTATLLGGPLRASLSWTDNATNETHFNIERSTDGVSFSVIGTAPARNNTGGVTYVDLTANVLGTTYTYRVAAMNGLNASAYSNTASVTLAVPADPTNVAVVGRAQGGNAARFTLTWTDVAGETGYTVQRATNAAFTTGLTTANLGANATVWNPNTNLSRNTDYYFRVQANNVVGSSNWVNATPFPVRYP